jgi:hypothetical protein
MSSPTDTLSSELRDLDKLRPATLSFFQGRTRNRLHSLVLRKFRKAQAEGLTKAALARRMRRRPEVVHRMLANPGNWRVDTLSDFLIAICGEEIEDESISPLERAPRNRLPGDSADGSRADSSGIVTYINRAPQAA